MAAVHPKCCCGAHFAAPLPGGEWPRDWSRRRLLGAGAGAAIGLLGAAGGLLAPAIARAQPATTPERALQLLVDGNKRFAAGRLESFAEDLKELREKTVAAQHPVAAILSCADSRVPVELVFDQSIGRLFVTRVAGNVATPAIIASLEYGAAVLGVKALLVLGHENCGAVKAAMAGKPVPGQISSLYPSIRPAVEQAGPNLEAAIKANARIQADLLRTASPVLSELVARRALKVVAGYYALGTGAVTLLD